MKVRWILLVVLLVLLASLLLPFLAVYPNAGLPAEVAAAFPSQWTGLDLLAKGQSALPLQAMPELAALPLRTGLLLCGLCLAALGVLCACLRKRWFAQISLALGALGFGLLVAYAFYAQQVSASILFNVMITAKWAVWIAPVMAAALLALEVAAVRGVPALPLGEEGWRGVSLALCVAALLLLLLPFAQTSAPAGLMALPQEDALLQISQPGWRMLSAPSPLLSQIALEQGAFADPAASGSLALLSQLSGSTKHINNLFRITSQRTPDYGLMLFGVILLAAGCLLHAMRKVDKWFPACLTALGAAFVGVSTVMMLTTGEDYQFMGSVQQMMALGLGYYTAVPVCLAMLACLAAAASVLRVVRSDVPYFNNPIPKKRQMQAVAVALTVASLALICAPVFSFGVYASGKVNPQNPTVSKAMSGLEMLTFRQPEQLTKPVDRKGKLLYGETEASNGFTAESASSAVSSALTKLSVLLLGAALILLAALLLLLWRKAHKRVPIVLLLSSAVLLAAASFWAGSILPRELGTAGARIPLYFAMATALFAAFFTAFLDVEALPKKFKLFLMMVPFLGFVLVFAYLPLAGWRYAFYDFRLGLPMDAQPYVGFKWFAQIVSSEAQRAEIFRVLRNTFAISGINLATSWMPVAFAILLSEIKTPWFKKFAQVFTTLPNFISWVLVFSFALTIFSLDTGVVNRVGLDLGLLKEPVAWLNSNEHIWMKMWLWSTWKGLGWGAIMYLAAIAGIDQELYEAARVDGAGRFRQILHITIPGVLPTFFVLLLLSISNIINNGMEQYLVFQNAMNKSTIEVLDLYVYNISLGSRSSTTISLATAIGILKSVVSIVLLFLANTFSKAVRGESIV